MHCHTASIYLETIHSYPTKKFLVEEFMYIGVKRLSHSANSFNIIQQ